MLIVPASPLEAVEAEALEAKIIAGIEELETNLLRFAEGQGWKVLGYKSFLEWFDARIRSVRVGPAIRAVVVHELQTPDPETGRKLTDRETAERLGTSDETVRRDTGRGTKIKSPTNVGKSIMKTPKVPEQRSPELDTVPPVPPIIDAVVLSDSHDTDEEKFEQLQQEASKEPLIETNGKLTKAVGEARRILLRVLSDASLTPDIIKLVLDDLIPEIEQTATEAERKFE